MDRIDQNSPTNRENQCPTVMACDAGYATQLATALRSLTEANPESWPIPVYVLADDFTEALRARIERSVPDGSAEIQWSKLDLSPYRGFSTPKHISKATYARLLIPSILPTHVQRALYLDADILVLKDLRPLWGTELGGRVVGAVNDL